MRVLLFTFCFLTALKGNAFQYNIKDSLPERHIKTFSRQQLKADMQYMIATMEDVHPNLYHSITKAQLKQLQNVILSNLKDSMTSIQAWPAFAQLVAAIGEGHSSLFNPTEYNEGVNNGTIKLFPVLIKAFNGQQLIVQQNFSIDTTLKAGDQIIKINGIRASDLIRQLSKSVGGLPAWQQLKVVKSLHTYLLLHNINPPYSIEYIHKRKKQRTTIPGETAATLISKRAATNAATNYRPDYSFELLKDSIAYLNFRSMNNPERFKNFLDSSFTAIQTVPVRGLIVDLRENGGGNSTLGDMLLSYLTAKPYRMAGGSKWKVSQGYKDFYNNLDSTYRKNYNAESIQTYFSKENGSFIESASASPTPGILSPLAYKGDVCFLIGSNTFSSANMLANAIQDYHLFTLIGEPTGEAPNDYGEIAWFNLPNTQIRFMTSSKLYIRANGNSKDMHPVLPDMVVKNDPATTKDEVVEAAQQWINKNNR